MKPSLIQSEIIILDNGITIQRLNDFIWYVIRHNEIIDYGQYRHDLIEKWKED